MEQWNNVVKGTLERLTQKLKLLRFVHADT
jgi:hypothetical protein